MNALIRNIAVSVVLTLMTAIGAQADDHADKMADKKEMADKKLQIKRARAEHKRALQCIGDGEDDSSN